MRELARELRGRVVLSTATLGGLERISTISLPKIEISEIPMAVANITPKDMMFMLSKGNASRKSWNSYDDTDSEDDQISSESEDEINVDMEQVAAEMKNNVELNKTVEDNKSNQWVCLYLHTYLFVTTIRSYDNHWKIKENKQMSNVFYFF